MEIEGVGKKLRPEILQLEWVIVGGKRNVFILKPVCSSLEIGRLTLLTFLWCVFPGRVP